MVENAVSRVGPQQGLRVVMVRPMVVKWRFR
jgi:hypothetical protein